MKPISDEQNARGVYIIFVVVQMILMAVMYSIVYSAYLATEASIEKFGLNAMTAYAPTAIVFVALPLLLYKSRQVFRKGDMMLAISWMMALLSIFLVGLMLHVSNISGVS